MIALYLLLLPTALVAGHTLGRTRTRQRVITITEDRRYDPLDDLDKPLTNRDRLLMDLLLQSAQENSVPVAGSTGGGGEVPPPVQSAGTMDEGPPLPFAESPLWPETTFDPNLLTSTLFPDPAAQLPPSGSGSGHPALPPPIPLRGQAGTCCEPGQSRHSNLGPGGSDRGATLTEEWGGAGRPTGDGWHRPPTRTLQSAGDEFAPAQNWPSAPQQPSTSDAFPPALEKSLPDVAPPERPPPNVQPAFEQPPPDIDPAVPDWAESFDRAAQAPNANVRPQQPALPNTQQLPNTPQLPNTQQLAQQAAQGVADSAGQPVSDAAAELGKNPFDSLQTQDGVALWKRFRLARLRS